MDISRYQLYLYLSSPLNMRTEKYPTHYMLAGAALQKYKP